MKIFVNKSINTNQISVLDYITKYEHFSMLEDMWPKFFGSILRINIQVFMGQTTVSHSARHS
jgi:hypothetical protein